MNEKEVSHILETSFLENQSKKITLQQLRQVSSLL